MKETLSERFLILAVRDGEWEIDAEGRVWRVKVRGGNRWVPGTFRLNRCTRRRAEKRQPSGYLMVRMMLDGKRYVGLAHRLVWQYLHGDIPEGLVINHKNGLKDDNRPDNLELETHSGNSKHAYRTGLRDEHGERNPAAKLSDHDVAVIRTAYATGDFTMQELATRFGCRFQHISRLVRGESRPKQGGATTTHDHRHIASERDAATGRFKKDVA